MTWRSSWGDSHGILHTLHMAQAWGLPSRQLVGSVTMALLATAGASVDPCSPVAARFASVIGLGEGGSALRAFSAAVQNLTLCRLFLFRPCLFPCRGLCRRCLYLGHCPCLFLCRRRGSYRGCLLG